MTKEQKQQVRDALINLGYAVLALVLLFIGIRILRKEKAKHEKQSTVEIVEPKKDKVSNTENQAKLEWLESVYNYELNNEKI